jgi:hypothetical protein
MLCDKAEWCDGWAGINFGETNGASNARGDGKVSKLLKPPSSNLGDLGVV